MTTATAPPRPPGSPPGYPRGNAPGMSDVRSALDALVAVDLAGVERDELRYLMSVAARVHGWLDSFDVGCARRARELADDGVAESPESLFGAAGKRSNEEASRIKVRADALDEFGGPADGSSSDPTGDADDPDARRSLAAPTRSSGRCATGGSPPATSTPSRNATRRLDADARAEFHRSPRRTARRSACRASRGVRTSLSRAGATDRGRPGHLRRRRTRPAT